MKGDDRYRLYSQLIDAFVAIFRILIVGSFAVWIGGQVRDVLVAYAGKQTEASVVINLAAKLQLDRWLAYLCGAGGFVYGLNQNRLRRRTIERLTRHSKELEKRLDPDRSSSNLTSDGRTRSGD